MFKQISNISGKEASARANSLLDFALAEFCSGIEMIQAAKRTDDNKLAVGFIRHAMDEYRHAYLFHQISKSVAERYELRNLNRYLPVHSYRKRYLDGSSFIFETKSPDRFSVFIAIAEKYAANHFAAITQNSTFLTNDEKNVLDGILKDEKRHISFAETAANKFRSFKPIAYKWYTFLEKKDLFQRNTNQRLELINSVIASAFLQVSSAILRILIWSIKTNNSQNNIYTDLNSAFILSNDMY